jgi:hypothetical protein
MKSHLMLIAIVLIAVAARAVEPAPGATELIHPFRIVAIPVDATDTHKAAAQELANALGIESIVTAKRNPVCCVWLEITAWTPNPGTPGYIIINQPGGSLISASDEKQLKIAVQRFKHTIVGIGKEAEVPNGLLTSFPVSGS